MAKIRTLAAIAVLLTTSSAIAQDVRKLAEAEGKMMFYASFNATDTKLLTDGFKQLYPKIDAIFYRATDALLMERILTEGRAGQNIWDVMMSSSFFGYNLKKRGMLLAYDSPSGNFIATAIKIHRELGRRSSQIMARLDSTRATFRRRAFPKATTIC
jgi:ABC-type glycerol-3-phosphate transport system substrate-binding protein